MLRVCRDKATPQMPSLALHCSLSVTPAVRNNVFVIISCWEQDMSVLGSVNVLSIHERYAYDLFSWGDYEGAVGHFLVAETPVDHVLSLFPSLAPPEFVPPGGSLEGGLVSCMEMPV